MYYSFVVDGGLVMNIELLVNWVMLIRIMGNLWVGVVRLKYFNFIFKFFFKIRKEIFWMFKVINKNDILCGVLVFLI